MSPPGKLASSPILCYVTDRKKLGSADKGRREALLRRIGAAAAAGVDWIQIREKDLPAKELSSITREAVAQTRRINERSGQGSRIFVNDRLDVAQSEHAGGVHLGENSVPVNEVCRWLAATEKLCEHDKFLVGVSCHSVQEAADAERGGADYIFFGPVFATPSKSVYGAPQGVQRLLETCSLVSIPVLAIGGITLDNASDCLAAGARGIAAIRIFQEAEDLAFVVTELRKFTLTKAD